MPDWLLERLALGELDAETAADVRRRLAAEGRSPDDIAALVAASNREILEQLPATPTAAAIRLRAGEVEAAARPSPAGIVLWGLPLRARRRRGGAAADVAPPLATTAPCREVVDRAGDHSIKGTNRGEPRLYVYRHGAAR